MSKNNIQKLTFRWKLPDTKWDLGEILCSRKLGGCGRWHSFEIDGGELDWDLTWESSKGEFACEKFETWLQKYAEQEWAEELKTDYLKEIGEYEEEETNYKIRSLVKLDDRQLEEKLGGYRPVGFRKGKREFFICGKCSKDLKGAGKHGRAKNRNNTSFWGLDISFKILCLACLKKGYYGVINSKAKKILNIYIKRGYV